jgi:hypothetical protein
MLVSGALRAKHFSGRSLIRSAFAMFANRTLLANTQSKIGEIGGCLNPPHVVASSKLKANLKEPSEGDTKNKEIESLVIPQFSVLSMAGSHRQSESAM